MTRTSCCVARPITVALASFAAFVDEIACVVLSYIQLWVAHRLDEIATWNNARPASIRALWWPSRALLPYGVEPASIRTTLHCNLIKIGGAGASRVPCISGYSRSCERHYEGAALMWRLAVRDKAVRQSTLGVTSITRN